MRKHGRREHQKTSFLILFDLLMNLVPVVILLLFHLSMTKIWRPELERFASELHFLRSASDYILVATSLIVVGQTMLRTVMRIGQKTVEFTEDHEEDQASKKTT